MRKEGREGRRLGEKDTGRDGGRQRWRHAGREGSRWERQENFPALSFRKTYILK